MSNDLKQTLIAVGISAVDAGIIADIVKHASMDAVVAMQRVTQSAPEHVRATTIIVTAKILSDLLRDFCEDAAKVA